MAKSHKDIIHQSHKRSRDFGISEEMQISRKILTPAELAFDDQCTGANPGYPSIGEIKELYIKAFEGK